MLQQQAVKREINAELLAASLAIEAYSAAGLDKPAITQAMQTAQALQTISSGRLDAATRLRAVSSIREAIYEARERERLIGHGSWVYSVAFSPDGETLAHGQLGHHGEAVECSSSPLCSTASPCCPHWPWQWFRHRD